MSVVTLITFQYVNFSNTGKSENTNLYHLSPKHYLISNFWSFLVWAIFKFLIWRASEQPLKSFLRNKAPQHVSVLKFKTADSG